MQGTTCPQAALHAAPHTSQVRMHHARIPPWAHARGGMALRAHATTCVSTTCARRHVCMPPRARPYAPSASTPRAYHGAYATRRTTGRGELARRRRTVGTRCSRSSPWMGSRRARTPRNAPSVARARNAVPRSLRSCIAPRYCRLLGPARAGRAEVSIAASLAPSARRPSQYGPRRRYPTPWAPFVARPGQPLLSAQPTDP